MLLGKIKSLFQQKGKSKLSRDDIQAIFRTKYVNFKILLDSNSELLKIISEIEDKLRGETVFGMTFIRSQTLRALFHAGRMIRSFESLSGRSTQTLSAVLDQIHQQIQQEQEIQPLPKNPGIHFILREHYQRNDRIRRGQKRQSGRNPESCSFADSQGVCNHDHSL
jgi:hypothetical protein